MTTDSSARVERDGRVGSVLVVIPTYNERENLGGILARIRAVQPHVHVLVVDDNSPDGTGRLADDLASVDAGRLHVMHRAAKQGLGAAYLAGFAWGFARRYDVMVEMDADGSHAPEQLGRLLDAIADGAGLAIGSRYVEGGETQAWPWQRLLLSRTANLYARMMLGTDVRDITAGFRAYRADVLAAIEVERVESKGYCFQIDLAWRAIRHGCSVVEVPITFVERSHGSSKMDAATMWEALRRIARWGVRRRVDSLRGFRMRRATTRSAVLSLVED
ncbi:polyprenol monophosphomannose synthase [Mycolicibacterium hodleri]|uniref:dolichyl-phosphate beta-D-mannosyltransferase n=1 Tax=Mycolicibacterium hodleri TaxID=49897 RepID=A0A502E950_9MYCO|nr:polyprenol monophosphomannose synthase [Mycolicibacterium hodleri]TPG34248.1 polyprenol monophosphomannose synthase [Mycolicibacterium hodleri]